MGGVQGVQLAGFQVRGDPRRDTPRSQAGEQYWAALGGWGGGAEGGYGGGMMVICYISIVPLSQASKVRIALIFHLIQAQN